MEKIYLDNAATTPVKKEVLDEMMPYFSEKFGNASTLYSYGRESKKALDIARDRVAKALGADPAEIYFTSGGTESDNWAIKAAAYALREKGNHIITTSIEHHAVLHTCEYLKKQGFKITYLPVDEYGLVDVEEVKKAITDQTILISVMYANNEVGTIEPVAEIGEIAKERGILFHTDAVQAVGHIPVDVKKLNCDMLSLSAHKFYGPKGIGALYIRKGVKIHPYMHGGGQEKGRRAGTENIPAIVGLGKAIELATQNLNQSMEKLTFLRNKLINGLLNKIDHVKLNGHPEKRLPGNVNISVEYVEGESMLLSLDMKGICASSGSACTSGSLDPSHVLLAMGLPHELAHGSLRFSIGEQNTEEEIDYVIQVLPDIVARLREMSPLYEKAREGK
ncbi:cysteine desulfurase [Caldanaerobius fijiensis DSM 17918]|uniref:Cysteine desulfurase IscS n=1 Tax=Caldanaerobius fijiensis DSM 17918 TaxID=1121256 RepID=A0A1M4U0W3_9THEO|nr:cysteine desulfurase NifS [Caldanaerobius fijiensis]SHE50226.1 cysteine desulfurase [Caldanaerobius fijiensis DSM 17918]